MLNYYAALRRCLAELFAAGLVDKSTASEIAQRINRAQAGKE